VGIVYHANYLRFAERARTELLRDLKINQTNLAEEQGVHFVVRSCCIEYLGAARLDDQLTVESRIILVRGASVEAEQIIRREVRELVRLEMLLACVDRVGVPVRMPSSVRLALIDEKSIGLKDGVKWRQ